MKNNVKSNKTCTIQVRCTKKEMNQLDKQALKYGVKKSDYVRNKLFTSKVISESNVEFTVKAQEFVNYIEEYYAEDKKLERKIKELWKNL